MNDKQVCNMMALNLRHIVKDTVTRVEVENLGKEQWVVIQFASGKSVAIFPSSVPGFSPIMVFDKGGEELT